MSAADNKRKSLHDATRTPTVYSRILDRDLPVRDARADFARPAWRSPGERAEVRAFLESKRRMIQNHPQFTAQEKIEALAEIDSLSSELDEDGTEEDDPDDGPPPPGGVGFGIFYTPEYKTSWETGSAIELYIACPTLPGGNVETWLYLTATNRTSRGVEAFVSYFSQDEPSFKVFDWARPDQWQIDRSFSDLAGYLRPVEVDGVAYQSLCVLNSTLQLGEAVWRNEVYLLDAMQEQADLVYRYDYDSTIEQQKAGWVGSWGPIVETFLAPG